MALAPFERAATAGDAEAPYKIQYELQDLMQDNVGIVRNEADIRKALEGIQGLKARAAKVASVGNREYNPGWHTALDLASLLACAEAIATSALERKESRGGHFREDYPDKDPNFSTFNHVVRKGAGGRPELRRETISRAARRSEAGHRGEQIMSEATSATFRVWRGEKGEGAFRDYQTPVSEGMVVLDAIHQIQAEQANDLAVRWNCKAGKCGSCSAEVNGMPKLMCMTRLSDLPLDEPVTVQPLHTFPSIRDLVTDVSWNFRVKKEIKPFKPRAPDAPDGTWRMQQEDIERVQEFRKCIECFLCQDVCHVLRDHHKHEEFIGPRFLVHVAALEMHPLDTEDRVPELKKAHGIGYCNITKCCTKVCPEHITITDNAIIPLKERVVDRFYDPVARLLRKLKP